VGGTGTGPEANRRAMIARPRSIAILIASLALFAPVLAHAAEQAAAQPDGRVPGVFAGIVLLGFIGYAIALCLRPFADDRAALATPAVLLFILALIKLAMMPILPGLGIDVGSYQAWGMRMAEAGPARMYQPGYFLDYPPGYLYALWAMGSLSRALGLGGTAQRMMIESPAIIADAILALLAYAFMRRKGQPFLAWAAMALVALNPALLFDTLVWGQSDSIPALLMLTSVVLALDGEFEVSWGIAAIAVLMKPQALMFLPLLGLWTLMKSGPREWIQAAVAPLAVILIAVAPFQIGHAWNWIFTLYGSTVAYYHETSVNAFNLMAIIGGLRQGDSATVAGISYFMIGMTMLGALYGFLAWLLIRNPTPRALMLTVFLALAGSFILGPRMHERYLYPALVFLVPLGLEDETPWNRALLGVLGALSLTFLFNLAYIKRTLEAGIFLDARDGWSMAASAINVIAFAIAIFAGMRLLAADGEEGRAPAQARREPQFVQRMRAAIPRTSVALAEPVTLAWARIDSAVIAVLVAIAAVTRLVRIALPNEIVFDEVHFVGQARHYLHGESFLDPHPPLAKLLIALSIGIFGDHSWAWRAPNAILGIALIAITYLLVRRMFASRLAAALAAGFVLCDGMFLIDSRIAVLDIVYLTFAAWSYLLLLRFVQQADVAARRWTLLGLGVTLGLCLGSKLYIPAITFLLVTGFLLFVLVRESMASREAGNLLDTIADPIAQRRIGGAIAMLGSVSALIYIATFIPHYWLGWWGGIQDLFAYYGQVMWYERSVSSATHPYSAPWWSWPLLLRPIAYWQHFPATGRVQSIWGGGNPALWWGALTAVAITAIQMLELKSIARAFLVVGYLAYLLIWVPIGRTLFLYHYMPSVYLGFIALAAVLAECWNGQSQLFEHAALMLTLIPVYILGLGPALGLSATLAMIAGYVYLLGRRDYAGKWVCAVYVTTALALFIYFLPIWIGLPIERAGYYARMWLQGPGLRNWI
jgi:predicted membrane-bound dolichyl-phosphate-mannose-protein mannosyltransferase